jgi:4-hydroxyphenylacetate decarboxylase small subunit
MEQTLKHWDCRNYAPLDAAKGICHIRKQLTLADGESCEFFERLPKCKHCVNYVPDEEENLGICIALSSQYMTYPDLSGVTCEWFAWKET